MQIRFAHHLDKWRKSIGKPLKPLTFNEFNPTISPKVIYAESGIGTTSHASQTCNSPTDLSSTLLEDITILNDDVSTHTDDASWENLSTGTATSIEESFSPDATTCTTSNNRTANSPRSKTKIDLEEILMNSPPNGPDLLQLYQKQKHFTIIDRKRLISTIVNYYLECKIPLDLETSYDLENAIITLFPNESIQMYRNCTQGRIFNRYTREKSKELESEKRREHGLKDTNDPDLSMYLPNESFLQEEQNEEDEESLANMDQE